LLDKPVGEQVASAGSVCAGANGRCGEQFVSGRLDQPGAARVVGAGPALLVVPCVSHVVEVGPPRWRCGVERLAAVQLDPSDQDMHVHPFRAVQSAVLDSRPGVPVVGQPGEREAPEVIQHAGDLVPRWAILGVEGDHRRGVAVDGAEAVCDRRHLLRIADQNLDVLPLTALVVAPTGQVGHGPGCRACAVG
jgi:hypothetical protein